MKRIHWPTVLVSVIACLVVTSGVATADKLITGKQIKNGSISEADLSKKVRAKLNQTPANGVNGVNGRDGTDGRDGANGQNGAKGDKGSTGAVGATGATGAQGVTGAVGAQGATGNTGPVGPQGDKGATGETGPVGPQGDKGETGDTGPVGPQGDKGETGETGAAGPQGETGETGPVGPAANQIHIVTEDSPLGWVLQDFGDNTTCPGQLGGGGSQPCTAHGEFSYVAPPSGFSAPNGEQTLLGSNALKFAMDGSGFTMAAYLPFQNNKLRDLTDLRYSSFRGAPGNEIVDPAGVDDIAMKIEVVGAAGSKFGSGYRTLVYEPYMNGTQGSTVWNSHNVLDGTVWASSPAVGHETDPCTQANPCSFADFVASSPNAVIYTIKLVTGQNSGTGWGNFVGYADNVTIGFGPATTYDLGG